MAVKSNRRNCKTNANSIFYLCGEYVLTKQRNNITSFVKSVYNAYFGVPLGDHDKLRASQIVCRSCVEGSRNWENGKRSSMTFEIPMIWREPQNHSLIFLFSKYLRF